MKIKAKIDRFLPGEKVRAIASVSLDGQFVVKGLRIIDGNKGLFVAGPQESYKDRDGNRKYRDLFFPISNLGRSDLEDAVLEAYKLKLEERQNKEQNNNWSSNTDEVLPF